MPIKSADLARFELDLATFSKTLLPAELVKFHREVVLRMLNGVIFKTPVDTGHARNGWQIEVNFIPQGQVATKPGSASEVVQRGVNTLKGLLPFSVVYLQNNVEYILLLENGSSAQAPRGMVSLTLEEVRQRFNL